MNKLARAVAAACVLALTAVPVSADLASATKAYGRLLSRYATPRGVLYAAWRASGADIKTLAEVLTILRSTDAKALEPKERKALYINLYNAKVVEVVLLGIPRDSIKDLSKSLKPMEIFNRDMLSLNDGPISLNDLEKRLGEEFKDPRIHFALNRGTKSAPPLRPDPYVAAKIDDQLDEATRKFLASPEAIEVRTGGGKATIVSSEIFDAYAADFKASGGALAFIAKYGSPAATEAIAEGKAKLAFADYDWSLNAAKP
jgi:hypothetical protein